MIFISLDDLAADEFDNSTYISVIGINTMNQPEETIRLDRNTIGSGNINENSRWIQDKNSRM